MYIDDLEQRWQAMERQIRESRELRRRAAELERQLDQEDLKRANMGSSGSLLKWSFGSPPRSGATQW